MGIFALYKNIRNRTSWCDRVDAGQLDSTDLTLRTSWCWVCLDTKNIILKKIPVVAAFAKHTNNPIWHNLTFIFFNDGCCYFSIAAAIFVK